MAAVIRWGLGVAVCAAAGWGLARAQDMPSDACRAACYEEQSACVDACGDHDDPEECEASCNDAVEDCLDRCP